MSNFLGGSATGLFSYGFGYWLKTDGVESFFGSSFYGGGVGFTD
jgi:hypothetical protein